MERVKPIDSNANIRFNLRKDILGSGLASTFISSYFYDIFGKEFFWTPFALSMFTTAALAYGTSRRTIGFIPSSSKDDITLCSVFNCLLLAGSSALATRFVCNYIFGQNLFHYTLCASNLLIGTVFLVSPPNTHTVRSE